jgi:hypothetical protein
MLSIIFSIFQILIWLYISHLVRKCGYKTSGMFRLSELSEQCPEIYPKVCRLFYFSVLILVVYVLVDYLF